MNYPLATVADLEADRHRLSQAVVAKERAFNRLKPAEDADAMAALDREIIDGRAAVAEASVRLASAREHEARTNLPTGDVVALQAKIEGELARLDAKLPRQRDELAAAIKESPARLAEMQAAITETEGLLDTRRAHLDACRTELASPERAARQAELDQRIAGRDAIVKRMAKRYPALHKHAEAWASEAHGLQEDRRALAELNALARQAGKPDVADPMTGFRQRLAPRPVADPVDGATLPGYLPRHPDGPPLAKLI